MSKPVVLLDVDGVVANFIDAFIGAAAESIGRRFTADQVVAWDISKCFGWGLRRGRFRM